MKQKIHPIKQRHSSGCGPTSIKMTTHFLGRKMTFKEIELACKQWKEEGMSNEDLVKTFETLGFKTVSSYNSSWEELIQNNTLDNVIVVSWMLEGYIGHFSVVDRVTDTHIWLADPESGSIVKMEKIIFLRLWLDYGEHWYPETKDAFQLRWMVVVRT
jgi:predicted double-glycine peptidase